ncbi:MAG TPA: HEAT repeat domain-containing protein [Pyrinomonadaceae bacterium]|jgi:HEAT repeat protein|nr:HEAT repeat domain-containing protein [Pyrinomonadaceae bacterium]
MKNPFNLKRSAISSLGQKTGGQPAGLRLVAVLALLFAVMGLAPRLVSHAQRPRVPIKVWNVAAQPSAGGTVVWITADAPLNRAQNWQDSEGYHLVLPNTVSGDSLKSARGVKIRRVGGSLEVLLQTKPGSKVSVQAEGNEISLLIDKKLDARGDGESRGDSQPATNSATEQQLFEDVNKSGQWRRDPAPLKFSSPVDDLSSSSRASSGETAHTASNWNSQMGPTSDVPAKTLPQPDATSSPQAAEEIKVEVEDEGALASIFSATSVFVVIALGLFGLLVSRKLRSRQALVQTSQTPLSEDAEWVEDQTLEGKLQVQNEGNGTSLVRSSGSGLATGPSRQSVARMPVAGPTTLFGAYRIDQEIGKLILGQPHRMDVVASRAIDDRRAIETSLIKGMNGADLDESARRRAREALEEYGFVARQCATLLLAPDAFERTSAARSLGEIKSEAALPFLLESLYDSESIVRNQAVVSIGELKLPSAIGALLDIARTHPDVPSALLSRTLSACSVEGLDFFDAVIPEPAQLGMGRDLSIIEQITHLEPASSVEELPESADDQELIRAVSLTGSVDIQDRAEALKTLAQFRVQSSVDAISRLARHDPEPNLRSTAIANLGSIDHESVFAAILIGMADESREVRAAAARALNRLSFDRADAYVRVIETSDEATISNVAKACVQAGIVSQNLDRLASSDHRQAYETFSLICLLTKANLNAPILDAITDHPNTDVRLKAVHLLASTGHPDTFEQLRQLAVRDGVREEVKTALLEAMYKLDQEAKRTEVETVEASEADSEPRFEAPEAETNEPAAEQGFEFAFEPKSHPEVLPEFAAEVESKLDELEM